MDNNIKSDHIEQGSIDIMKLILAILILAINCINIGFGKFDFYVTEYIARLAVPLFFCTSGYFLFENYSSQSSGEFDKKVKKYEINLLKIYFIWNAVYLFVKIYFWIKEGTAFIDIVKYFYYVFIGIQYQQLWYIGASIVGVFIIWLLLKKLSIKTVLFFSVLFYLIALFFFTYVPVTSELIIDKSRILSFFLLNYNRVFSTFRNGVFFGFPFLSIGAYMAVKPKKINIFAVCIVFIAGMSLLFTETVYLKSISSPYHGMMLFLLITTPCIFDLVRRISLKPSPAFKNIRKLSTYFFLFSEMSIFLTDEFILKGENINALMRYLLCIALSFVFSIVLMYFKNKIRNKNIQKIIYDRIYESR